ncbi:hypothetical protein PACTADRAFT_51620, partial [Pachysolen tannophilus NRRL Y-2460]
MSTAIDEKKALIDLESQHIKKKKRNPLFKFITSDTFLILTLITSIVLLYIVITTSSNKKFSVTNGNSNGNNHANKQLLSIPVNDQNTFRKMNLESSGSNTKLTKSKNKKIDASTDPDQRLAEDIRKTQEDNTNNINNNKNKKSLTNKGDKFNVLEEYNAIVALSPVILITWDDEMNEVPIKGYEEGGDSDLSQATQQIIQKDYEISKNFKNLITKSYQIFPQPTVVSIDKHPHYLELINYIMSKVEESGISKKNKFLPGLIINGRPVASGKAIESLHGNGKLVEYLKNWGDGVVSV